VGVWPVGCGEEGAGSGRWEPPVPPPPRPLIIPLLRLNTIVAADQIRTWLSLCCFMLQEYGVQTIVGKYSVFKIELVGYF
jgi:hypothetical protein